MPVVKLKKAVLYYHKSIQDDVLLTLQKSGVCEIIPVNEEYDENTTTALEAKNSAASKITKCDAVLTELRFLLRLLEPYYKDPASSIDMLLGEKPGNSLIELAELAGTCNTSEEAEKTRCFEVKLASIKMEISQLENMKAILANFIDFPYMLNIFSSKERLRAVAGNLPAGQTEMWKENLLKEVGNDCEIYLSPSKGRDSWGVVMYASERESEVMEICSKSNFTICELNFSKDNENVRAGEQFVLLNAKLDKLRSQENSIHSEIAKYADEHVDTFRKLTDHWSILKERAQAFASGDFTDSAVVTSFWIPDSDLPDIESKLAPLCEIVIMAPSNEDVVPSLIKNKSWCAPCNILTRLFSPPQYGGMDPTPQLAPFFFVFFGMCFGDAGYALIMAGLLYYVFRKYTKIPTNIKEFFKLFMIICLPTFVYGAITGSFFGDLFAIAPFLKPLDTARGFIMLFDPMQDPMLVLVMSFALGAIHVFYGLILSFRICWIEENYVDAIFDKGAWMVFLISLLLIAASAAGAISRAWMGIAQITALVCALIIIWHAGLDKKGIFSKIASGLFALYGATSWLGDVLSYSRLLALGLCSATIAMIINLVAKMLMDVPYVGWLIAIVVLAGGHIFNLALGVLGAFVHSLRLQYVEFFGKFYSGGGRDFNPLSCKTKYVNILEK